MKFALWILIIFASLLIFERAWSTCWPDSEDAIIGVIVIIAFLIIIYALLPFAL